MPWDYSSPRTVRPGDRVRIELPHSEVCMHMRVAGQVMDVRMTDGRYPMAQLLNSDPANNKGADTNLPPDQSGSCPTPTISRGTVTPRLPPRPLPSAASNWRVPLRCA